MPHRSHASIALNENLLMSGFTLIVAGWVCVVAGMFPGAARAGQVVWVALSGQGGPYDETVESIRADLQRGNAKVDLVVKPWADLVRGEGVPPSMVVTVGVAALQGMIDAVPRVPLLATLVPRAAYARVADAAGRGGRTHTAVWLDQPAGRQLDLLRLALPARKRVAVVFGPESRVHEEDVQRAAADRRLSIAAVRSEGNNPLSFSMPPAIDNAEVLLALPDRRIYNGETLPTVLAATYRRGIPVLAFSPAFTRAGALLALYSTPTQLGTQVGEIARATLAGRPLPPPQAPRDFTIDLNAKVARSLGIAIDSAAIDDWVLEIRAKERAQWH